MIPSDHRRSRPAPESDDHPQRLGDLEFLRGGLATFNVRNATATAPCAAIERFGRRQVDRGDAGNTMSLGSDRWFGRQWGVSVTGLGSDRWFGRQWGVSVTAEDQVISLGENYRTRAEAAVERHYRTTPR